ncbi:unnamed protein product [Closterium sp. NIES-54]
MLFRPDPISRRGIASSGSTSYTSPGPRACDPISSASNGALSHAVSKSESRSSEPPESSFASQRENIDVDRDASTHVCGRIPRFHGDASSRSADDDDRDGDDDDGEGDDDDGDGDDGDCDDSQSEKGVVAALKFLAPAIGGGGFSRAADEGEGGGGEGGSAVARGRGGVGRRRGRRRIIVTMMMMMIIIIIIIMKATMMPTMLIIAIMMMAAIMMMIIIITIVMMVMAMMVIIIMLGAAIMMVIIIIMMMATMVQPCGESGAGMSSRRCNGGRGRNEEDVVPDGGHVAGVD